MRVYIAGGSSEAEVVASYVAKLRAVGIEITKDWSADVLRARSAGNADAVGRADHGLSEEVRIKAKDEDLAGVDSADVMWLIYPQRPSFGAGREFGRAVERGKMIVVSGAWDQSIFTSETKYLFANHEAGFEFITSMVVSKARLREVIADMFRSNAESGVSEAGAVSMMAHWVAGHLQRGTRVVG